MSALDVQVGGEHYKTAKIQPVQYIEANQLAFLEGCVVKRVTRHNKPTGKGRQDIEKAIHELQLLLELRYGEEVEATSVDSPKRSFVPQELRPPRPEAATHWQVEYKRWVTKWQSGYAEWLNGGWIPVRDDAVTTRWLAGLQQLPPSDRHD